MTVVSTNPAVPQKTINQLHQVIADPYSLISQWNEAVESPGKETRWNDRLFADQSLLRVGSVHPTPGACDLILDIGGSDTKFVIRTVSDDGSTVTWTDPIRISNASLQQEAQTTNPDFLFDGYAKAVMRRIACELGAEKSININGIGVIWSNRMEPYVLDNEESISAKGIGGIVPVDCEFTKGEFFTRDNKLQGQDLSRVLIDAAAEAGMCAIETFAISNDTVFTANAMSTADAEGKRSIGGLIASTGTNVTLLVEELLRNAEAGVGLHIPKEYLTAIEAELVDNFEQFIPLLKELRIIDHFQGFQDVYNAPDRPDKVGLRAQDLTGGKFIPGWFTLNAAHSLGLTGDEGYALLDKKQFAEFASAVTSKMIMNLAEGKKELLEPFHLPESAQSIIFDCANAFAVRTTTIIALLTLVSGKDAHLLFDEKDSQPVVVQDSQVLRGRAEFQKLLDMIINEMSEGSLESFPVQEIKIGNDNSVSVPSMGAAHTLDLLRAVSSA